MMMQRPYSHTWESLRLSKQTSPVRSDNAIAPLAYAQPDEIGLAVIDSSAGKCIGMSVSLVPGGAGNGRTDLMADAASGFASSFRN
jgi:hypothetical protein